MEIFIQAAIAIGSDHLLIFGPPGLRVKPRWRTLLPMNG
ncbi:hypothetical protein O9992_02300 [Vibrio lentus]|nr:hypothetical protein [Vibrio lentus]